MDLLHRISQPPGLLGYSRHPRQGAGDGFDGPTRPKGRESAAESGSFASILDRLIDS